MQKIDTTRISRRRVPADADEHVHRCECGGWRWDARPCTTCTLIAAARLTERLQAAS